MRQPTSDQLLTLQRMGLSVQAIAKMTSTEWSALIAKREAYLQAWAVQGGQPYEGAK